jgi:uncharacterized Tic20 family protein
MMAYCTNCGSKLNDLQDVCLSCGKYVSKRKITATEEENVFGYSLLGFFIPIVGLVLYLIWQTDKPKQAKAAGKGALISVIIYSVLMIILVIIYLIFIVIFINLYGDYDNNFQDFINLLI